MDTLPCQLVDPVLSLSNALQKAMHVRVYHHFGSSSSRCQNVKSTQSCNTARQLVDPVLSLSNALQKAMHVRVYHHFGSSSSRCQDVKSTQSCNTARQLVDPVLSLSNALQKAMHVRVYHHFGSSSSRCQDVKSTQSCNTALSAGWSCLESQQCSSESHACKSLSSLWQLIIKMSRCQEHSIMQHCPVSWLILSWVSAMLFRKPCM